MYKYCLECKSKFYKPYTRSIRDFKERAKYCSRTCQNSSYTRTVPWNKGKGKIYICSHCKTKWQGINKTFCSRSCAATVSGFQKGHIPTKTVFLQSHIPWNKDTKGLTIAWNRGIKFDAIRGENHWNWKGGMNKQRSNENLSYIEYRQYRDWQKAVFQRDDWECQSCGKHGGILHADHIKPWAIYKELRYDLDNGRTLCPACHIKTATYGQHKYKLMLSAV